MIIQVILIFGLLLCIGYAFLQRRKSLLISLSLFVVSGVGIFFVVFPLISTDIANFVGVGRGADLVIYCWALISLLICVNLQFKILGLYADITQITRTLAIHFPGYPTKGTKSDDFSSKDDFASKVES